MNSNVSFQNVTVRTGNNIALLDCLSLELSGPGLFGIVGPNGAGKSSLIRAVLGLLPLSEGVLRIAGRVQEKWSARSLARHIGYVPQQILSHWDLSVAEMLQLQTSNCPAELIERCQLAQLMHRRFATLSGGEQARVAIARALSHQPSLLLADEPAAHLDLPHQHRLLRLLRNVAETKTVLLVLHDLHLASRYCDHLTLLSGGRLIASGCPETVLAHAPLHEAYADEIVGTRGGEHRFFTM